MAIFDKLRGVGEAVRDKVKGALAAATPRGEDEGSDDAEDGDPDESSSPRAAALDLPASYLVLGLADGATLADAREAYRTLARDHHPRALREGSEGAAQRTLDRLLEALELLEEQLVPLAGATTASERALGSPPQRKRATARAR